MKRSLNPWCNQHSLNPTDVTFCDTRYTFSTASYLSGSAEQSIISPLRIFSMGVAPNLATCTWVCGRNCEPHGWVSHGSHVHRCNSGFVLKLSSMTSAYCYEIKSLRKEGYLQLVIQSLTSVHFSCENDRSTAWFHLSKCSAW